MTLSEPGTVLPLFVKALGGSSFLAGLLPSLRYFGWLTPQFLFAGRMQRFSRFLPITQFLEIIRSTLYLGIAALVIVWGRENPPLVLALFFVLFMITRFAAGCSAVARNEIIARMVPPRERPTVISIRRLTGGVAGFLAGFVVRYILDERTSTFPLNYALLIGFSGIAFGFAIFMLSGVVEPKLPVKHQEINLVQQLKRAPAILRRDRRYALYIGLRMLSSGLTLAAPFYILYSAEVLKAPASMAGIYISIRTLFRVLSNAFWGKQCQRRSSIWVLKTAAALGVIAPIAVVLLSWATGLIWSGQAPTFLIWLFGLVFLVQGLTVSGQSLGRLAYLYDISPENDRPTYYGLSNTIVAPIYFLPAVGGALIDIVGYVPIFAAAAVLMGLAYALASRMDAQDRAIEGYSTQELATD